MSYIAFGEGSSQLMTDITINISPMDTTHENFSENKSGEGSRQPITDITNISPMETTKGKINEGTSVSALTRAQRRQIVNRNYYQRSKEKKQKCCQYTRNKRCR